MKICVLGAGSLGCAIGAKLAQAGSEVWLINRSPVHVTAINSRGLEVVTKEGEHVVKLQAATTCAGLSVMDLVIVLVKSFDTRSAAMSAKSVVGEHTVVMSLQNGLGHEEILAEIFGAQRVVAGKSYVGGQVIGPGRIISGTAGKQTLIGELDGSLSERIQKIASEFNRAELATTVSTDIMGTMWDKLLVNVATGALSAITRLSYGPMYAMPELKATAVAAVSEAMAVARAAKVNLSFTTPEQPWVRAGEGLPAEFKASMLQSIEKGSITEIDFINGAVVRGGQRYGIATPVNSALVACVKGIEAGMQITAKERV